MNYEGSYAKLQHDQKAWVAHNFKNRIPSHPLHGIVEELGELDDAINQRNIADIGDSAADVMIYMADYCSAMGLDLVEDIIKNTRGSVSCSMLSWVGKLNHSHLKLQQGIRGEPAQHLIDIQIALQTIVHMVELRIAPYGINLEYATISTWNNIVKKRDWQADATTGGAA